MRISCIECIPTEVQQRQYQSKSQFILLSDAIKVSDQKIDFLKDKNKEVKDRRDRIDTKARTLLTLTSLLLGLISSATNITSAKAIGIWSILPLTLLFITVFLLTVYFGIDHSQTIDYSYIFSDSESAKKTLCNDLLLSQDYNERVTDFMIDLYRAALRYFSLAMLCIMFLGVGNIVYTNINWAVSKNTIQSFFRQESLDSQKSSSENISDFFTNQYGNCIPSAKEFHETPKTSPASESQIQPAL